MTIIHFPTVGKERRGGIFHSSPVYILAGEGEGGRRSKRKGR